MDDLARINRELNITIIVNLHSVKLAKEMQHELPDYVMEKLFSTVLYPKQPMKFLRKSIQKEKGKIWR